MSSNIIPYFISTYSTGKGLFTLTPPTEINPKSPISVFSVAKHYKLPEIYLVENSFTGFIKAYQTQIKSDIPIRFAIKLCVCNDNLDKTDESINTESNVVIWILNSAGYKDLVKIFSYAATEGFYYIPRISWKTLKSMWTDNLGMTIPFYSGFIARNLLENRSVIPELFGDIRFVIENHDHPLDRLITDATNNFCKTTNYKQVNMHKCCYFLNNALRAAQTYRIAVSRSEFSKASINKPEIAGHGLNTFSFEHYLELIGKKI